MGNVGTIKDLKPVLYVEDDANDTFFMRHAWKQAQIKNELVIVSDGESATDYLLGRGDYSDRKKHPMPCLVLLDVKLPVRSGLEVLQWIRQEPTLSQLLVIMFTSSSQDSDVNGAYNLRANGYLLKPASPKELVQLLKCIEKFWLLHSPSPPPFMALPERPGLRPQVCAPRPGLR